MSSDRDSAAALLFEAKHAAAKAAAQAITDAAATSVFMAEECE